jgi:hypothetical protein
MPDEGEEIIDLQSPKTVTLELNFHSVLHSTIRAGSPGPAPILDALRSKQDH